MSEAKFTNGKWVAFYPHELLNDGHISVETESGKLIYFREVHKTTLEEQAANANLIAAAPEMYEMLDGLYAADMLISTVGEAEFRMAMECEDYETTTRQSTR